MKDKIAGAGLALMMLGISLMDSPNIAVPIATLLISFVLTGIAFALEYKTERTNLWKN